MTSVTLERLRETLKEKGLVDQKFLADALRTDAYKQLLTQLFAEAETAFEKLASGSAEDATFESVVETYHEMDDELKTLWLFLDQYNKTDGDDATAALVQEFQPKLVRLSDKALLDTRFYGLLEAIWAREADGLSPAAQRSMELLIRDRKIAGVHLPPEKKVRLQEINERLSELGEKFGRNAVESRKIFFHHFEKEQDVAEFPEQDRAMAKAEAEKRGLPGWVFTLSPPSRIAIGRYCADAEVRKKFMEEGLSVGTREPYDNRPLVLEILSLRREKARLLGFKDYAEFVLQTRMAATEEAVRDMLHRLRGPYQGKAVDDIAELTEFAKKDLNMWDVGFHSNKMAKEKFKFDEAMLQDYFELEATLSGMYEIANRLFSVEMKQLDVPAHAEDVRSFEVWRKGSLVGYFVIDLFVRPTKRAGAWCGYLRGARNARDGTRVLPIITNTSNFPKGGPGKPTLLSHHDAVTLFHEFGHALHALLSEHEYPNLESFAIEWDFVELPSQLLENWCWDEQGLALFAKHHDTGETIPDWMLDALRKKRAYMKGYEGVQQLEYASLDVDLHTLRETPADVAALDAFALEHERKWQVLPVPDFYRMYAAFSHIFEGGYAVGYYSYTWAELLEADAFGVFEKEGLLDATVGERYRREILAPAAMKPGADMFRGFMGRDMDPKPLLRKKGMKTE